MGNRSEICETIVDDEISFAAHTAAYECRGHAIQIFDLVTETVACRLMSGPVFPQGIEVHVAEIVFDRDWILLHDVGDAGLRVGGLRELEPRAVDIVSECNNIDALSVLGDTVIFAVENFIEGSVAHILEGVYDDVKCPALVVDRQSFDILAENDFGPVEVADPNDIEEQSSAGHAFVVVVEPLFSARDGERLARESSEADIEVGNVLLVNLGDVPVDLRGSIEIGSVCLLRVWVPFASEYSFNLISEGSVESHADSAYSRKQVDGSVFGCHLSLTTFSILSAHPEMSF